MADEEANDDVYQETEYSGFFGNLGDSFAGVCVGLLFFFGAFPLLWWNEGRAVDNYQAIREGRDSVIEISTVSVNPNNNVSLFGDSSQFTFVAKCSVELNKYSCHNFRVN